jgi:hypothetical protein
MTVEPVAVSPSYTSPTLDIVRHGATLPGHMKVAFTAETMCMAMTRPCRPLA